MTWDRMPDTSGDVGALRARSFGQAADAYDQYRPRYPQALIDGLEASGLDVLDVGAGTGIASRQFADAGAHVVAVEPDPAMANVAKDKGIDVEVATFEAWDPAGRRFDLVVFAQSFHWVEAQAALAKVGSIRNPGGRLLLLWNRLTPVSPTQQQFDEVYANYLPAQGPVVDTARTQQVLGLIRDAGFAIERHDLVSTTLYSTDDWLDMVFTYSNHLILPETGRTELRARLRSVIGDAGVAARNDCIALICSATSPNASKPLGQDTDGRRPGRLPVE